MPHLPADCMYSCVSHRMMVRLNIEKQEGKRKYESDGEVMVGEFVCVCGTSEKM